MKENKKTNYIFLAIFLFMLYAPTTSFFFLKDVVGEENLEKRTLTEKPILSFSNLADFPKQWDAYYNDHLPYRNQIVTNWRNMHFVLLNESVSDRVIVGKDSNNESWLFYNDKKDGDEISFIDGRKKLDTKVLDDVANKVKGETDKLKDKGMGLYYIVGPNKSVIYSKNLPSQIGVKDDYFVAANNYFQKNGVENIFYSPETLKNAAEEHEVYWRTDTHWNDYGGYVYVRELMKKIYGEDVIGDRSVAERYIDTNHHDLHGFTGLSLAIKDNDVQVSYGYEPRAAKETVGKSEINVYENENYLKDETVLLLGDSFTSSTVKHFASTYRKTVVLKLNDSAYDKKLLEQYQPSKVFCVRVERKTPAALIFSF